MRNLWQDLLDDISSVPWSVAYKLDLSSASVPLVIELKISASPKKRYAEFFAYDAG